ncbi:MAG: DUF1559 domain-containing protein [Planctomycetaceae bacterium]
MTTIPLPRLAFCMLLLATFVSVAAVSPCTAQDKETSLPDSVQRYIDAQTIAAGWIDLSKLDLDGLEKFSEPISGPTRNLDTAKSVCTALVELGVARVYWATDLAGLANQPQAVIIPVPVEKREVIATILRAVAAEINGVVVIDDNVVLVGSAAAVGQIQARKDGTSNAMLLADVNRIKDPHGIVVLTPAAAVLPVVGLLPQLANVNAERAAQASELLVNLQSITISGELPPSHARIQVITKSAETAERLTALINAWTKERIADASDAVQFKQEGDSTILNIKSQDEAAAVIAAIRQLTSGNSRKDSMNSLKQIALAMHNFHNNYGYFPPQALTDAQGKRMLSWRVMILPYLDQAALYNEFHLDEPWDSEHNRQLIKKMPALYRSKSRPGAKNELGTTCFVAPLTRSSTFGRVGPGVGIREITDGTSNTLMIVEASADKSVIWTKPEDVTIDDADPLHSIINQDAAGFAACLCDGSARFLSKTIDAATLKALLSINGGEVIDQSKLE